MVLQLNNMKKLVLTLFITVSIAQAQERSPFSEEIRAIQKKYDTLIDPAKETLVFTGSSSIRIWYDVQERFPDHQIVNSGFGGSQASDLLAFSEELILQYKPKKVFIYEGDNDIAAGKSTKSIIKDIAEIINTIREQNQAVKIILIAAKPSIARWNLKRDYKRLNRKFKKMCRRDAEILFADVWKPMLHGRKVKRDIFSDDGLHMNAKGYTIWYDVLKPFVEE